MRCSFALLALFGAVSATLIPRQSFPNCALTCIASANLGGCSDTDDTCLCNSSAFVSSATTCIESTCTGSDLQSALTAAQSLCASVGVTLSSINPSSVASSGSVSGTSSSASSTSGSTTKSGSSSSSSGSSTSSSTSTSSSSSPTTSSSGAGANGVNAFAGLAALGLAVFAL